MLMRWEDLEPGDILKFENSFLDHNGSIFNKFNLFRDKPLEIISIKYKINIYITFKDFDITIFGSISQRPGRSVLDDCSILCPEVFKIVELKEN